MKKTVYILLLCVLLIGGCAKKEKIYETLGELSYDKNRSGDNTVYLVEDDRYVPFLVLTDEYNDTENALLLRKNLLDDPMFFNEGNGYDDGITTEYNSAYYAETIADLYLTTGYPERIAVRDSIVPVTIEITDRARENTEAIERKVFLLSATEVGDYIEYSMEKEGEPLAFFKDYENKKAYTDAGEAGNWWLRTRSLTYRTMTYTIGYNITLGMADTNHNANYLRPAFCLPNDMAVQQREVDGQMVYIVE